MADTRDSSFPRDLLKGFMCVGGGTRFPMEPKEEAPNGWPEKVELSLGLSLNGRFGAEPHRVVANDNNKNNKLFRVSSVVDFVNFPAEVELSLDSPLTRTCSLPPETEWRKRKEFQSLRRSEAKRKRVERLKNVAVVKGQKAEDWDANRRNLANETELWGAESKQSPPPPQPFSSQGSIGSQGSGGSSGVSDFESQPSPGTNRYTEVKNSTRECFVPNQVQWNPSRIISGYNRSRKVDAPTEPSARNSSELASAHCPNDGASKTMLTADMPCVSTRGDGAGGRKIQGFLYRYGDGEEVRIVCVCHGSFLTPAEFVKHGGGGDVDHPLRHIIVAAPSSFS